MKFPKRLSTCVDLYYQTRAERLAAEKVAGKIKIKEMALHDHILMGLNKERSKGISGKIASVKVAPKDIVRITDWKKAYAYIKRTGSFDFLTKKTNQKAILDRLEGGRKLSFVEVEEINRLSISKL